MQKENVTITSSDKINCPYCEAKVGRENFCSACGRKLVKVCNCWRLNRNFDCGHNNDCPTIATLLKEFGRALFPSQ
jgi:hypothetical protein